MLQLLQRNTDFAVAVRRHWPFAHAVCRLQHFSFETIMLYFYCERWKSVCQTRVARSTDTCMNPSPACATHRSRYTVAAFITFRNKSINNFIIWDFDLLFRRCDGIFAVNKEWSHTTALYGCQLQKTGKNRTANIDVYSFDSSDENSANKSICIQYTYLL